MEKKLKGFLVILGALIMGSVALTPLTSYAADGECTKDNPSGCVTTTKAQQVNFNIQGYLTLDAVSASELIRVSPGQLKTGSLTAEVTSTGAFTISLSATNPSLVHTTDSSATIPAGTSQAASTSGWGIKKFGAAAGADYTALTATPTVFYDSGAAGNTSAEYEFEIGVWVDGQVKEGMYSTQVTVTAATKE